MIRLLCFILFLVWFKFHVHVTAISSSNRCFLGSQCDGYLSFAALTSVAPWRGLRQSFARIRAILCEHLGNPLRAALIKIEIFSGTVHWMHTFYLPTRGLLRCLLGFWPLGQNPAEAIIIQGTYLSPSLKFTYFIIYTIICFWLGRIKIFLSLNGKTSHKTIKNLHYGQMFDANDILMNVACNTQEKSVLHKLQY